MERKTSVRVLIKETCHSQLYSVHPIVWLSRSYTTSLFESTKSARNTETVDSLQEYNINPYFYAYSKFTMDHVHLTRRIL